MYICYSYHDYRKEFYVKMHKIFPKLSDALAYAKSLADEDNDTGVEYVCHKGKFYDAKEKDGGYDRIAVDSVKTYLDKPDHKIKPGSTMYIVYYYHDYRKENFIEVNGVFDIMEKAIEFASELGDGEESNAEYACHEGELFDQREKDGCYGRIAVDSVSVGDD